MCTVTYLPVPQGFVLTHNRDEAPSRSQHGLSRTHKGLLFPKDAKAGGAWIAAAKDGRTACLLNGAFVKHRHEPPYRRSRGLVLLDFFDWPQPDDFFQDYDLAGIEPFTFLFFRPGQVLELRWDGTRRHLSSLSPQHPHFWCSATLYPPDMQRRREDVFRAWVEQHRSVADKRLPAAMLDLHLRGSVGDPTNDFVMNREGRVRTVSVTQVVRRTERVRMAFCDLLSGAREARSMQIA